MLVINMLDGESIEINHDTMLIGLNNAPRITESKDPNETIFYLKQDYIGTLDSDLATGKSSSLATSDKRFGIVGFLLSHDAFATKEGESETIYFTSAVKSVSVV